MKTDSLNLTRPMSAGQARLYIVLAALFWSLSGALTKILTKPTIFNFGSPEVHGLAIAFYRVFFAGLVIVPALQRREVTFRPLMTLMAGSFACMNLLFIMALAWGTAANTIWLQYTAPLWLYLAGIWWLGEQPDRRSTIALVTALAGVGVIVLGGKGLDQLGVLAIALGSGITFAAVLLCFRVLRAHSPRWLTLLNHAGGSLVLLPICWWWLPRQPTWPQMAVLVVFGIVQTALPYFLAARALSSISAREAGMISLLEPLLNPLWAYLVSPDSEAPSVFTLTGACLILVALVYRYYPGRDRPSGV